MRISRVLAVYCLFRGIDAADAGKPITDCPYDPDLSTTDFYASHWWRKGWTHRAFENQHA